MKVDAAEEKKRGIGRGEERVRGREIERGRLSLKCNDK